MRVIVAYLAACTVAATVTLFYYLLEIDAFPKNSPSIDQLFSSIAVVFGLILGGTGVIGGVLAIPWLSMYFVFGVNPTRRNCMLFGAVIGFLSILAFQLASLTRWPIQLDEIDLWRISGATLLFAFAGIASGLTYWAIAERNQT